MARLVIPASPARGHFTTARSVSELPPDTYKDRLVKYIPAEAVAFYAFADKLVMQGFGVDAAAGGLQAPADPLLPVLSWALLVLGLIGTPLYLYRQRIGDQPWRLHAAISTVAFLMWAYTLGGSVFVLNGWYHQVLAGLAAPVFTFVAGMFEPRAR